MHLLQWVALDDQQWARIGFVAIWTNVLHEQLFRVVDLGMAEHARQQKRCARLHSDVWATAREPQVERLFVVLLVFDTAFAIESHRRRWRQQLSCDQLGLVRPCLVDERVDDSHTHTIAQGSLARSALTLVAAVCAIPGTAGLLPSLL